MDSDQSFTQETPVEAPPADLYRCETIAQGVKRLEDLEEEHIRFFHEQGYLIVHQVFEAAPIKAAYQAIDDLMDGKREDFKGLQFEFKAGDLENLSPAERRLAVRKLMNFVDYDERFEVMSHHPGILAVLERLIGATPLLFQDMALLKPPRIGREKPWHQDCAYFNLPLGTAVVATWIALERATPENGCLHLIPGSHHNGPMPHFWKRDWQICDTDLSLDRNVMVALEPGGCLFWHGMLHHASPPNQSDRSRRALQFHYKSSSAGEITLEERMELFGGEAMGAEC